MKNVMKNVMNILIILIAGMMFACNDNVYEDFDNGMIIQSKDLRDITPAQPWLYEYIIADYSNTAGNTPGTGNPGNFYLYSSTNFSVGDVVIFTTQEYVDAKEQKLANLIDRLKKLDSNLEKERDVFEDTEVQK